MKLHLGCGNNPRPVGYIHLDARLNVKPDLVADVTRLPCRSDVFDELYFSHGLEHIRRPQVQATLEEWARVLERGGTIRLAVPDFKTLVHLYEMGRMPVLRILGLLYGKQDHVFNYHYCCYDYDTLAIELQRGGFYDIDYWLPSQQFQQSYDDFSFAQMDGICVSLNVVARAK